MDRLGERQVDGKVRTFLTPRCHNAACSQTPPKRFAGWLGSPRRNLRILARERRALRQSNRRYRNQARRDYWTTIHITLTYAVARRPTIRPHLFAKYSMTTGTFFGQTKNPDGGSFAIGLR
jgi:hypothetical protein